MCTARQLMSLVALCLVCPAALGEGQDNLPDKSKLHVACREVLGESLYGKVQVHRDTLHFYFVENMRHGAGQGENFTLWRRGRDETQ